MAKIPSLTGKANMTNPDMTALQPIGRECIALAHFAGFIANGEPSCALFTGAMGEGMRLWHAACAALQMVIPDHPGRFQGLLQVAGFKEVTDGARPNARQAIGLQFKAHCQGVCLCLTNGLAALMHLSQNAQLVLDVMRHLVGHHIGRGKIAPCAQLARQGRKELGIQIGLAIRGAVKRPRGPACPSARALCHARIKHQNRRAILLPHLGREDLRPDVLCRGQDP